LNALKIKTIDYLFVTHADTDHCGSLAMVVQCKKVLNAYLPTTNMKDASEAYLRFHEEIFKEKGCAIHYASRSTVLSDEAGTYKLSCLYPYTLDVDENVAAWAEPVSSVMWLDYMGVNALFMGDAETEIENMLMSDMRNGLLTGVDLTSTEILKVGHHGSSEATSKEFIDYINPQAAVISCGENNYGHPSETVLSNLNAKGVEIFRTDINGTVIVSVSSGEGFGVGFVE
jgi:competence protein ComEC